MPVIPPGTSAYSVARASLRVEVGLQHLDPRRALADLEHDYAVGHRRLEFFNTRRNTLICTQIYSNGRRSASRSPWSTQRKGMLLLHLRPWRRMERTSRVLSTAERAFSGKSGPAEAENPGKPEKKADVTEYAFCDNRGKLTSLPNRRGAWR